MSSEQNAEPLDVVVTADGSGVIDASQLAHLRVTPGAHLSVVPVLAPASAGERRSVRGVLAHLGQGSPTWADFEAASEAAIKDHEPRYAPGGRWGPPAQ